MEAYAEREVKNPKAGPREAIRPAILTKSFTEIMSEDRKLRTKEKTEDNMSSLKTPDFSAEMTNPAFFNPLRPIGLKTTHRWFAERKKYIFQIFVVFSILIADSIQQYT